MTEWWTYRLSSFLMFSPQVYQRLFEQQNRSGWLLGLAASVFLLALLQQRTSSAARALALVLSCAWLWVAWTYFAQRYAHIHLAGTAIAIAFGVQGVLLFWFGVLRTRLQFAYAGKATTFARVAASVVVAGWPLLAPAQGRSWWQAELFALAPDPTALATLAVLAACRKPPLILVAVPLAWLLFSGATLWSMGMAHAALAPVMAIALAGVLLRRRA